MSMGVAAEKITVLRNGVDAALFTIEDQRAARRELGWPDDGSPILASVGNLVPGKRHHLALEAATLIGGSRVVFVGRGPERARLERLADERGMAQRVRFLDEMPQQRLRLVYSAADVLVLASEREGWPNVLLESAACGTPAVAFAVGGIPEILTDPNVGTIVRKEQTADSLAASIQELLANLPPRETVRAAAVRFSWEPVLDAQLALYRRVAGRSDVLAAKAAPQAMQA
jgi:glycosyltransferase involved in cell wall biosynthesis